MLVQPMARRHPNPYTQRQRRVGEEIRHALAAAFSRGELRDPAIAGRSITVTEVRCSADLRAATAFVLPLGGEDGESVVAALERSARFLRGRVTAAVALRHSPQLAFVLDRSFDEARRIEEVLAAPEVARDLDGGPGS